MILLQSNEDVRALILERYSYIYPVPIIISDFQKQQAHMFYQIAYFMKPCKSILSYGILKASWTKCGKSALVDEIFSTDFTSNHNGNFEMRPGNPKWGGF